ncbi:hypothetical protein ABID95_007330 [Streptomyces atratus]
MSDNPRLVTVVGRHCDEVPLSRSLKRVIIAALSEV